LALSSQQSLHRDNVNELPVQKAVLFEDADLSKSGLAVKPLSVLVSVQRMENNFAEAAVPSFVGQSLE
jgi:hypothetical protein